jgi:hypothetical protein
MFIAAGSNLSHTSRISMSNIGKILLAGVVAQSWSHPAPPTDLPLLSIKTDQAYKLDKEDTQKADSTKKTMGMRTRHRRQ